jgi:phosphoribosylformylglycinamidine synthase
MKAGVVVFPGSNCERDVATALERSGAKVSMLWHRDTDIPKFDLIVLPGGFSYGDYLRTGAMAAHSPVMREVKAQADKGARVLGICNGFQIMAEAQMVPGVLRRNKLLKYVCKDIYMRVEANDTPFTKKYKKGQIISYPVGHGEGNYYAPDDTLKMLEDKNLIAFRYCDASGEIKDEANPNGAMNGIAGIYNEKRNVLGLMPHPDRAADAAFGKIDGKAMFDSLVESLN